jgi:hypothetical protein
MTVDGVRRKYGSTSRFWEADLMQAAYLLELLCRYRLEAEACRAELYVNIHQLVVAGNRARADDLRRFIPATEAGGGYPPPRRSTSGSNCRAAFRNSAGKNISDTPVG